MDLIWCSKKIIKFGFNLAIFAILRQLRQIFSESKFIGKRYYQTILLSWFLIFFQNIKNDLVVSFGKITFKKTLAYSETEILFPVKFGNLE